MMQQNMSAEEMGRIWDRVAPPPPPPPPERPDGTEELLRAAEDAARLRVLYGRKTRKGQRRRDFQDDAERDRADGEISSERALYYERGYTKY